MSGFNPDAMDKVSAALTCGAADKDKPAARMPPTGTSGSKNAAERDKRQRRHFQSAMHGGCQRGNAERKQQRKRTKKKTKKKATGFAVLFGRGLFYKGGDGEDLSLVGSRVEREERRILLWSYASNDYI